MFKITSKPQDLQNNPVGFILFHVKFLNSVLFQTMCSLEIFSYFKFKAYCI
uniref:Uncharacterized protein n=1 Tax=Arundo donax TaxID=35708 RepID=A0A0A8ZXQ6_ARUDO